MNDRERLGGLIADLREKRGLTVRQLADMCGITFQNINKIENGKYNTGVDNIAKIARALDAELTILIRE